MRCEVFCEVTVSVTVCVCAALQRTDGTRPGAATARVGSRAGLGRSRDTARGCSLVIAIRAASLRVYGERRIARRTARLPVSGPPQTTDRVALVTVGVRARAY